MPPSRSKVNVAALLGHFLIKWVVICFFLSLFVSPALALECAQMSFVLDLVSRVLWKAYRGHRFIYEIEIFSDVDSDSSSNHIGHVNDGYGEDNGEGFDGGPIIEEVGAMAVDYNGDMGVDMPNGFHAGAREHCDIAGGEDAGAGEQKHSVGVDHARAIHRDNASGDDAGPNQHRNIAMDFGLAFEPPAGAFFAFEGLGVDYVGANETHYFYGVRKDSRHYGSHHNFSFIYENQNDEPRSNNPNGTRSSSTMRVSAAHARTDNRDHSAEDAVEYNADSEDNTDVEDLWEGFDYNYEEYLVDGVDRRLVRR